LGLGIAFRRCAAVTVCAVNDSLVEANLIVWRAQTARVMARGLAALYGRDGTLFEIFDDPYLAREVAKVVILAAEQGEPVPAPVLAAARRHIEP
jgi:hypothetical protein